MTKIRAMITKIPGFLFSSYRQIEFFGTILTSTDQYIAILKDLLDNSPEAYQNYETLISDYNFSMGIPKTYLFVKLDPGIDSLRREYIANGIRSYFRDDITILIDKNSLLSSINSSLMLF